eukprot:2630999-Ditylum_brightwellii.AAC.1
MKTYCLKGGWIGYKGDALNIEQDIGGLVSSLSQRINQLLIMIVQKNTNVTVGYKDFKVRCQAIQQWLTFFHAKNPLYDDINIDFDLLSQLPEDGSIKGEVNVVEEEELGQNEENISSATIETSVSLIQATLAPEKNRASG